MFHHLEKYAHDDSFVKSVFDHLRNIGIVALVVGAAAWKFKHIGPTWGGLWDMAVGAVLWFVGFGIMWLNHENLFSKIRSSSAVLWLKIAFSTIYTIAFVELLRYLEAGRA